MNTIKVKVGEPVKLSVMLSVYYAGMISPSTFSFTLPSLGNYFYPTNSVTINLVKKEFKLIHVDEDEIELQEI